MSVVLANLIGAVAALLPASMGAPLRRWATNLRKSQAAVRRVERGPRRFTARVRNISRLASRIKLPGSQRRMAVLPTRTRQMDAQGQTMPPEVIVSPEQARGKYRTPPAAIPPSIVDVWTQTPVMNPGETLAMDLLITPIKRPPQSRFYAFTVTSKSVKPENAPLSVEEGSVRIARVSWFYHLLPFLLFVVIVVLEFLLLRRLIVLLLNSTGVLG